MYIGSTNVRRCCDVTPSLIRWAHAQNDPWWYILGDDTWRYMMLRYPQNWESLFELTVYFKFRYCEGVFFIKFDNDDDIFRRFGSLLSSMGQPWFYVWNTGKTGKFSALRWQQGSWLGSAYFEVYLVIGPLTIHISISIYFATPRECRYHWHVAWRHGLQISLTRSLVERSNAAVSCSRTAQDHASAARVLNQGFCAICDNRLKRLLNSNLAKIQLIHNIRCNCLIVL